MTNPVETYLEALCAIRSSGAAVKETSGYGALATLFDAIGHTLKPKVRCFINMKNSGAGLPDGGLFTADQLKNTDEDAPLLGIPQPSRGVIEVKATDADVEDVADTQQVRDYVRHYGQVLVTNYRSFLLLKRGEIRAKVTRSRVSFLALLAEQPRCDLPQLPGRLKGWVFLSKNRRDDIAGGRFLEGTPAAQHLVENDTETPLIGSRVDDLAAYLLG